MKIVDEPTIPSEAAAISSCEREGCCSTTEDGSAVCVVPQTIAFETIQVVTPPAQPRSMLTSRLAECLSLWQRFRAGVMFVVACVASPCCTPVIVPVVLALLAGTPAALWMSQNLGVVFGGLTLLSAVSFVLAFRWMRSNSSRRANVRPTLVNVLNSKVRS